MDYLKSDMYIWILLGLGVLIVGFYVYKCFFKNNKKSTKDKGANESSKSVTSSVNSTPKSTPSQTPQIKASFPDPSSGSSSSSKKKNKLLDKMRKHKN